MGSMPGSCLHPLGFRLRSLGGRHININRPRVWCGVWQQLAGKNATTPEAILFFFSFFFLLPARFFLRSEACMHKLRPELRKGSVEFRFCNFPGMLCWRSLGFSEFIEEESGGDSGTSAVILCLLSKLNFVRGGRMAGERGSLTQFSGPIGVLFLTTHFKASGLALCQYPSSVPACTITQVLHDVQSSGCFEIGVLSWWIELLWNKPTVLVNCWELEYSQCVTCHVHDRFSSVLEIPLQYRGH